VQAGFTEGKGACLGRHARARRARRAQEGVRPGQRLLALSDPIRGTEMWPITPSTSSLGRVRDAFKLRRAPTVDLVVSAASVEDQLEGAPAARRPRPPRDGAAAARAALQAPRFACRPPLRALLCGAERVPSCAGTTAALPRG
jgi:hypothetical protein